MKQIDTGGLSFSEIRKSDKHYVDKTLLIRDILDFNNRGVFLFTRPRRFGKTTNLTMLDAFFNIDYAENRWFDNLDISQHPEFDGYRNAFPVIFINLKETKAGNYDEFVFRMKSVLRTVFDSHRSLLKSDKAKSDERKFFQNVLEKSISNYEISDCIPFLCRLLERHYDKKVVVLIDEYDRAVSDSFGNESHRQIMNMLGQFMDAALKNNNSLQMAVVTGVMQIAKESIFSDLNNIKVNNIFSLESDERFGFTETEVKQILADYGHPEKFAEAQDWYDGYRFGSVEIYNPFSIMNYVADRFVPKPFWANSGGDSVVRKMLECIDDTNFDCIVSLVNGHTAVMELDEALVFGDVYASDRSLFSLMAMSGYLKAVPIAGREFTVSVPNREVADIIDRLMKTMNPVSTRVFAEFGSAVMKGEAGKIASSLQKILIGGSYLNLREYTYEAVLMTLLYTLSASYDVRTEYEAGNGRTDIVLLPKVDGKPNMIFELKVVDAEDELDDGLEEAMEQIHSRRYDMGMRGETILVAISLFVKIPRVRIETV